MTTMVFLPLPLLLSLLSPLLLLLPLSFLPSLCPYPSTNPNGILPYRYLSMDISNTPSSLTFLQTLTSAQSTLHVDTVTLALNWNQIETSPNTFNDPYGALASANSVYSSYGVNLSITIRSIDTTGPVVPSDINIATTPWNSTLLINRYNNMISYVLSSLPLVSITNVMIANEIDAQSIFKNNYIFWAEFSQFVGSVKQHIHSTFPSLNHQNQIGTKVGFTVTHGAILSAYTDSGTRNNIISAATYGDCLGITYYPLNSDYTIISTPSLPYAITDDLPEMLSYLPSSLPLFIQEIGIPTSNYSLSTEDIQRGMIDEVFRLWNLYNDRIPLLSVLRYSDLSLSSAQSLASGYGLSGNIQFVEYLRTLGMVNYNGTQKEGFTEMAAVTTKFIMGGGEGRVSGGVRGMVMGMMVGMVMMMMASRKY